MSKYSAGCIFYYPSFHSTHNPSQAEKLQKDLKRYLTRKIGFEAVMRIRCTKGMALGKVCSLHSCVSQYACSDDEFIIEDFLFDPATLFEIQLGVIFDHLRLITRIRG